MLKRGIANDPTIGLAHLDLCGVYYDGKHQDAASHQLREAEKLEPNDADVHLRLARFYKDEGNVQEPQDEFGKTLQLKQAANATIFSKMRQAPDRGSQAPLSMAAPTGGIGRRSFSLCARYS